MTTNITPAHSEAFEALRDPSYSTFALFSCFLNGEPAVAIVAIHEDDGDRPPTPGNPSGKAGSSKPSESASPGPLKNLAAKADRSSWRWSRAGRLHRRRSFASDDFIAAESCTPADMRAVADHDQVADLRIAIDCAQNRCLAADTAIVPYPSVRARTPEPHRRPEASPKWSRFASHSIFPPATPVCSRPGHRFPSKLNYNACLFGDGEPVTLKFADAVGEILTAAPLAPDTPPLPFKYYI